MPEPTVVSVSVGGSVGGAIGACRVRTVALDELEVVPSADDAVATFVTLPAATSDGEIR
jgi:hypothetical protein